MAEPGYIPDSLNQGLVDTASDLASLKSATSEIVSRQNFINASLAALRNEGYTDITSLIAELALLTTTVTNLSASVDNLSGLSTYSPSAAGTETYTPAAGWKFRTILVNLQAGVGAYTFNLILAAATEGAHIDFRVAMPAGAGRTINIKDGVTTLASIASTAVARWWVGSFVFDGTNWVKTGAYFL